MYPADFFSLFPPFPREDKVFVAMSFDKNSKNRWENVIVPAVHGVRLNKIPLQPYRVDTRKVSNSVLTEILQGISTCRLIFADITSFHQLDKTAIRNANVFYEVGLAHAIRQPEEVILFRSDEAELPFNITNIRVNKYDPDHAPEEAIQRVKQALTQALKEIDLQKSLAVNRAADTLDAMSWSILLEALAAQGVVKHPVIRLKLGAEQDASKVTAIHRLLDLGILSTKYIPFTPKDLVEKGDRPFHELFNYHLTPFGRAVVHIGASRMGILRKEMKALLEAILGKEGNS